MAFWITHLRIAEALKKYLPEDLVLPAYYAGSIGPDCGHTEKNEDGTPKYVPGRIICHWMKEEEINEEKRWLVGFDEFYDAWMTKADNKEKEAFYWGYYIHLISDAMWTEHVIKPRKEALENPTPEAIREIKDEMQAGDIRFLQKHPDYEPLAILEGIREFPNQYLDYFNDTDIFNKIQEFIKTYRDKANNPVEESLWLQDEELDEFIMFATAKSIQLVKMRRNIE